MNTRKLPIRMYVIAFACLVLISPRAGAQVSQEKQHVLDWLSRPEVVERFGRISDAIWSYAELGLQEYKSSALLIETLEPTCFVASYGSGKPVIGILAEYDALPMLSQKARVPEQQPLVEGAPGHGCGHNLMGTAVAAAAIAVKRAMDTHDIKGTVKVFGSPAEEMLVSRPYMVRAGLFEGVDAVINNHTSSGFNTGYGIRGSAMYSVIFTFKGKTAHSAGSPWSGRSALDAVEIMNVATNYLREHLNFTHRMHYVIPDGGEAPNVVPDKAGVWYFLRNSDQRLKAMYERVLNCAKGAALATGTELAGGQEYKAHRHARMDRARARICEGAAAGNGTTRERNAHEDGQHQQAASGVHRRRIIRSRRRDADRSDGDYSFPRQCARSHGPPLVHRGGRLRFERLERAQRRRQSDGDVGDRSVDGPRSAAGNPQGV